MGSAGIAPCILDLISRWRDMVSFMLQPFYLQGKKKKKALNMKPDKTWRLHLVLCWKSYPDSLVMQPIA
jgi:hypothetical protein